MRLYDTNNNNNTLFTRLNGVNWYMNMGVCNNEKPREIIKAFATRVSDETTDRQVGFDEVCV